jgi:hypothetical protein
MTEFNSDTDGDFYSAISGNLYLNRAPARDASDDDINYPYAVFFKVSHVPDYFFGGEVFEEILLQFDIFDDSPESALDVETYAEYLHSLLDDVVLTLTNYRCLKFERELSGLLSEGEAQELIWHHFTQYRVLLEKK